MEIFEKVKSILFKPKEEWTIVEAENDSHVSILTKYLLILALIPAVAIFVSYWWQWHSLYNDAITRMSQYGGRDMADVIEKVKEQYPFMTTYGKMGIIMAIQQLVLIVGGAYIAAAVINAFSNQFGAEKNFDRAFALVAYSFTPLCLAGILYLYKPLSFLIPYVGLYGAYLLYLGAAPQLKPTDNKKTTCFVISIIVVLAVWGILSRIVPEITQSILIEQAKSDGLNNLQNLMPR